MSANINAFSFFPHKIWGNKAVMITSKKDVGFLNLYTEPGLWYPLLKDVSILSAVGCFGGRSG